MKFARYYLLACAVVFLGIGVALLTFPAEILMTVDIRFETPTAYSDIRADYGGCILGVGIFLCWCAARPERIRAGLFCCGLVLLGYVIGRLLSLAVDGFPKPIIFGLIAVEAIGAITTFTIMRIANDGNEGSVRVVDKATSP